MNQRKKEKIEFEKKEEMGWREGGRERGREEKGYGRQAKCVISIIIITIIFVNELDVKTRAVRKTARSTIWGLL